MNTEIEFNSLGQMASMTLILDRVNWVLIGFGSAVCLWLLVQLIRNRQASPLVAFAPPRGERLPIEVTVLPVLVLIMVQSLIAPLIARSMTGSDLTDLANPKTQIVVALSQNIATVCALLAAYWIGVRYISQPGCSFVLGRRQVAGDVLTGVFGALAALAICQGTLVATQWLIRYFDPLHQFPEHRVVNLMISPDQPDWVRPLMWMGAAVITPFAEEFFFRGILQTLMTKLIASRWMAIIAAGVLFGFAHSDQPQVVPAITAFGIILGVIYERRGSLTGPIIAHAIFNAKTLLWVTLVPHAATS
ncbi:MAG TPA: CPBP family intramembrane metalloprotease [Phycisphaerae bacterium]|nr:CPBP family intramembrane metalloprotease [Phycisphaerae bacterium]